MTQQHFLFPQAPLLQDPFPPCTTSVVVGLSIPEVLLDSAFPMDRILVCIDSPPDIDSLSIASSELLHLAPPSTTEVVMQISCLPQSIWMTLHILIDLSKVVFVQFPESWWRTFPIWSPRLQILLNSHCTPPLPKQILNLFCRECTDA